MRKHSNIYSVLFSLVLTATVMTIFEISFAYVVIFPGMTAMRNGISKLPVAMDSHDEFDYVKDAALDEVQAIIRTGRVRERALIEKNNRHTKVFASFLIGTLIGILAVLRMLIARHEKMTIAPYLLAGITVTALVAFQLSFYAMTNPYVRPGLLKGLPAWKFSNPKIHLKAKTRTACKGHSSDKLSEKVSAINEKFLQQWTKRIPEDTEKVSEINEELWTTEGIEQPEETDEAPFMVAEHQPWIVPRP